MIFGLIFAGVGVTVLVSIWTADGFGAPPLIFRMVGSFIALAFCTFGVAMAYSSIKCAQEDISPPEPREDFMPQGKKSYSCPHCGAGLGSDAEVSPHGDVKCSYCDRWFNIHTR